MARHLISLFLILYLATPIVAQKKFLQFPYDYNSFINSSDISWACENYTNYSFHTDSAKSINIHAYLVSGQKKGLLKCYLTKDYEFETLKKWAKEKIGDYYTEINYEYNNTFENSLDTADLVGFHEILYLQDHILKSQTISAAPLYKAVTSTGVWLGNYPISYSCLNFFNTKQRKNDSIYFLGHTNSIINLDSLEETGCLKKSYLMSLPFALWHDLTRGFNKVIYLKTQSKIPSSLVMEYSPFDSIETFIPIDSIAPLRQMVPAAPAYYYFSNVEIEQDWYYNKSKDIFFNKVDKVYLYIKYQDQKTFIYKNEKRFEILFDK